MRFLTHSLSSCHEGLNLRLLICKSMLFFTRLDRINIKSVMLINKKHEVTFECIVMERNKWQ